MRFLAIAVAVLMTAIALAWAGFAAVITYANLDTFEALSRSFPTLTRDYAYLAIVVVSAIMPLVGLWIAWRSIARRNARRALIYSVAAILPIVLFNGWLIASAPTIITTKNGLGGPFAIAPARK